MTCEDTSKSRTRGQDKDHHPVSDIVTDTRARIHKSRLRRIAVVLIFVILVFLGYTSLNLDLSHRMPGQKIEQGTMGRTLIPTNYTVVQGIFKQSDPKFKDDNYDVLGDSFGLIDKSPERWRKFQQYVPPSSLILIKRGSRDSSYWSSRQEWGRG